MGKEKVWKNVAQNMARNRLKSYDSRVNIPMSTVKVIIALCTWLKPFEVYSLYEKA